MYSREIDGRTLTLAPSGWTYDNTFVLYDRETGTLWYPYERGLKGIQGEYFNRWLEKIPSETVTMKTWEEEYPNTKILR